MPRTEIREVCYHFPNIKNVWKMLKKHPNQWPVYQWPMNISERFLNFTSTYDLASPKQILVLLVKESETKQKLKRTQEKKFDG